MMEDLTRFANPMTARGDLITMDSTPKLSKITLGASNSVLQTNGSDPSWATLSAILDASIGSTRGSVFYRGSSVWSPLTPGTSGYALSSNGSGADPSYAATPAAAAVNVLLVKSTNQSIGSGLGTRVVITSYGTSTNNGCTVDATNGTITVITAGAYFVCGYVLWASNSTGERYVSVNGLQDQSYLPNSDTQPFNTVSGIVPVAAVNDVFSLKVLQSSGGNLNVTNAALAVSLLK